MNRIEKLHWEKYKEIQEVTELEIIDTEYYNESQVGLKKRSGRRVGNDVARYNIKYPKKILVYDKSIDKKHWISVVSEESFKYVTGEYDYSEYIEHRRRAVFIRISSLLLLIVSLFAFGLWIEYF
ncbi:hypothetical protein [Ornithinibacillus californiensis]|uniref:hypothetical protein n=1 Tax=Ornithinibacillus californiensis TaxID=161536 RepID=UPI00064DEF72|nr:hypothetical protein [Ornithinibacillus californiensis]